MKRFKYIFLALVVAVGSASVFTSCEDSDKFRFPELSNGGFVKFVSQPDVWEGLAIVDGVSIVKYHIGADPATASFDAITEDPSNNIASFDMFVRGDFEGAPEEPIAFKSTTTFPFDVSFTAADMAALFNIDVETIQSGDNFYFTSVTTLTNGIVYNSDPSVCDCPTEIEFDENGNPVDEDGNPIDPGTWNGGTIDSVILMGGDTGDNFLLPAVYYNVQFLDPTDD